ncbi:bifunctional helix-turn-helix domain-containing protein/methylated-DNA--[protein]-cysteine S-methyltransferase [Rhodobacteraceae bacterium XHP0102]|nr:bifunctional helix-turn-helix domain-containing protein/methylated-DNA--[protein]-cysteine S-methyltransferase [Rhodobacteraceae bacterium XHP0102]
MRDETGEAGYHFGVIARAIALIDENPAAASNLDHLAQKIGLSPAHLQRVFSRYAGISPKRYAQFLTLAHAKSLLTTHHSTLETAVLSGLSGTGRLHDLFLRWEAMAPGDYAKGGAGLTLRYGWFDSVFGPALVIATPKGICGLGFAAEMGREACLSDMVRRWPKATVMHDPGAVAPWAEAVLTIKGKAELHLIGAPFQIKVWEALMQVPAGHVTTYSTIAAAIGAPKAVRAVGTAVGRNPISLLIPCHRALRKSGEMGGYHWGLPVKRAMLAWESAAREV